MVARKRAAAENRPRAGDTENHWHPNHRLQKLFPDIPALGRTLRGEDENPARGCRGALYHARRKGQARRGAGDRLSGFQLPATPDNDADYAAESLPETLQGDKHAAVASRLRQQLRGGGRPERRTDILGKDARAEPDGMA